MKPISRVRGGIGLMAVASLMASGALAQEKQIKIGLIFDQTGPFAGGGSLAAQLGSKYAIDIANERGGVEGYKIVPIFADAQSRAEVAVNEAERLINEQRVDMLMGVYSSAHCVPLSAKVDAAKKILVGNGVHFLRRIPQQEPAIRVSQPRAFRPMGRSLMRHAQCLREVQTWQRAKGAQGCHHPRGWTLWRRRRQGQ
jgi:hypothetical protein